MGLSGSGGNPTLDIRDNLRCTSRSGVTETRCGIGGRPGERNLSQLVLF